MISRRHPFFLLLISALLFATILPAPGAAAREISGADRLPSVNAAVLAAAETPDFGVVRQGYDLLLDRYVVPPAPAELLNAAYLGVAAGLTDAGVTVKSPGPIQLDASREGAWTGFRERLSTLLRETPGPDGFDAAGFAIAAMARSVDEGHTAYMSAQQYKDFLAYLRGDLRYGGIGLRPRRPGVTVAEVFPGSPAEQAGLQAGDMVVLVDGEATEGMTLEEVARLIRGTEGTAVRLDINRPGQPEMLSFTIVRAMIKVEYVDTRLIQGDIAYVRLRGFPEPSVIDRVERFLDQLPSLQARALIIDLRGNSGGRVDLGVRLLNRFIDSGPLFSQVDRTGQQRVQFASGPGWNRPLPVAILIDEGTASMGEIFASAMHEHGLARLIGKKTSGLVAAAQVFPLSDGSAMQVTILEIFSGEGERLNRIGVQPDDTYETSPEQLEAGRDVPLEAAVLYVWSELNKAPIGAAASP